jgi:adenylate cyclase
MGRLLLNRWFHTLLLLLLLGGALFVRGQDYDWVKALRFISFDAYNKIHPRQSRGQVAIVDIDEISLSREDLGQWPWSRDVLARMVTNLTRMGARAIVFDMVFAEADRTSPRAILQRMPGEYRDSPAARALALLPDNDAAFAQAVAASGKVVTAFIWAADEGATRRSPVLSQPLLMAKPARALARTVPAMAGVATNLPQLAQAAAGNGSFGVTPEVDGIIRRVPLLFSLADPADPAKRIVYPSLAIEAVRVAQGAQTLIKIRTLKQAEMGPFDPPLTMNIGAYNIPFDWDGEFFAYYSPARGAQYIPAWQAADGTLDPALVRDKIVFIGTSAEGLKDIRSTPLSLFIPGVEVHANVVEQILDGQYLRRPGLLSGAELLTVAAVGLCIILLAPFAGAGGMALFTVALIAGLFFASWRAFLGYGLLLDPVYPSLCLFLLFVLSSLLTYARTEAERRRVRTAFGFYISPAFMDELTRHPDKLKLGGETRDLTVMFTDIRNFTTISESLPPEELIQLMNDFLTPMSDLVMSNRGTIDKYMGDAMMAFWNAPLDDGDHARNACITALKMNETLAPLNAAIRERTPAGRVPVLLKAGIGINSGNSSVGNMGSRQRFAYSALGDTVNLASRLESQTKVYGVNILIGEQTRLKAQDFASLEVDLLRVKGKTEPVRVHALLGAGDMAQSPAFRTWSDAHGELLAHYRAADFTKAMALIEECRRLSGGDMATYYAMLTARIAALEEQGVPPGWDGTFVAESK